MIRRNNPGNVRYYGDKWLGLVNRSYAIGEFCEFVDMYSGLRAMMIDILGDIAEGKDTIRKVITEYAPTNENNTAGYINTISNMTGIHPDTTLYNWENGQINVIYSMVKVESGEYLPMNFVVDVYDDVQAGVYNPSGNGSNAVASKSILFPVIAGLVIYSSFNS
jgi:hypothetical protein